MLEKLRFIVFLSVFLPLLSMAQNVSSAYEQASIYLNKAEYDKAIACGKQMLEAAQRSEGDEAELRKANAHAVLGQAYTMKGNEKKAWQELQAALKGGLASKSDAVLCVAYNGLGLYATNICQDYYQALSYYFKGINAAKRAHDEGMYTVLLSNIVGIYYLQKDITGLKYAQEVYDIGRQRQKPFLTYMGAMTLASMYYLKGEYERAFQYVREAERLMKQHGFQDQASVYDIYGYIWYKKKDRDKALSYFNMALGYQAQSQASSIVDAYRGMAEVYAANGEVRRAIVLLLQALDTSYKEHNALFRSEMLGQLSALYEKEGNLKEALRYYKLFHQENDRLFNAGKERAVNEMRAKYDVVRQESELRQNRLQLLEKDRNMQLLLAGLCFIMALAGLMYYLYLRKNKLYRLIVRQHQIAIKQEENLRRQLEEAEKELREKEQRTAPPKYGSSSLSEEKKVELFRSLERLFQEKSVYKDNLLTKKKVADLLDSNQTYLSQLINEQTGLTFTQYINGYRIKEAVRLLSDPHCDTPLKALASALGFNSMTTFYHLFQNEIGMTPAQYRKSVVNSAV